MELLTIPAVVVPVGRKNIVSGVQSVVVDPFELGGINEGVERFEVGLDLSSQNLNPSISNAAMASTGAEDTKTVYVDETGGSDESGDGTQAQPYKSAAHAIFAQGPSPPLVIMTRKSDTEQYAPIGVSPLKKARKGAEGLEKQRRKALEAEAKAKEQAELLERSKAVTLIENPDLPKAVKVRSIMLLCGVKIDILAVKNQPFKGTTWTASSSIWMGP